MLDLRLSMRGSCPVLSIVGRIDNTSASMFEESFSKTLEKYTFKLVLDFRDLEYTNSSGLRALLVAARKARQAQMRIIMCQIRPNIREIFDMSGLSEWCSVHSSLSEACASLAD